MTDPLGVVRYDLYRATEDGVCAMSLPLAANDPAGTWTVTVKELLNNTYGTASFTYKPAPQCGALAGMTRRAVFISTIRTTSTSSSATIAPSPSSPARATITPPPPSAW